MNTSSFSEILRHKKPCAQAILRGSCHYPHICGTVRFYHAEKGKVLTVFNIRGLPVNHRLCQQRFFAVHIHEKGTCEGTSDAPFSEAGEHYNPCDCPHPMHAGDLGILFADCNGTAQSAMIFDSFSICEIINGSIIIHKNPDDFVSQPSGNAGERIACGVIMKCKI